MTKLLLGINTKIVLRRCILIGRTEVTMPKSQNLSCMNVKRL